MWHIIRDEKKSIRRTNDNSTLAAVFFCTSVLDYQGTRTEEYTPPECNLSEFSRIYAYFFSRRSRKSLCFVL